MTPPKLTKEAYLTLKVAMLDCALQQERAERALERIDALRLAAFRQAGLDPTRQYRFDDQKETVVLIEDNT